MAKAPYVLLFLGLVLIYLPRVIVIRAQMQQPGGLDNHNPRDQQARLTGVGRRANAAHQNMLEAFPIFAAGILASMYARVELRVVVGLGAAFVVLRLIYVGLYLADLAWPRTSVWLLALSCSGGLLLAPLVLGG